MRRLVLAGNQLVSGAVQSVGVWVRVGNTGVRGRAEEVCAGAGAGAGAGWKQDRDWDRTGVGQEAV